MFDQDVFHDHLDNQPADEAARWLMAEWLSDRGDRRADCFRWMVEHGKYSIRDMVRATVSNTWDWWSMFPGWQEQPGDNNQEHDRLPPELMKALAHFCHKTNWSKDCAFCEYHTRDAAEEALCQALIKTNWLVGPNRKPSMPRQSKWLLTRTSQG